MNKILLIGDIKINQDDFYHVGDEAAFNEVFRRLETEAENVCLSKFLEEVPPANTSLEWIKKITEFNQLPTDISIILQPFDTIWFVGSGNLNSLYPTYLYHRVALILGAKILKKTVILTSQTIGPFDNKDEEMFHLGVKNIDYISIRDKTNSASVLNKLGVNYEVTHDDATNLFFEKAKLSGKLQLGISLRDWDSYLIVERVKQIIKCFNEEINIHLIPHLIDKNNNLDIRFMKKHFSGTVYDYDYFHNSGERFDIKVKSLTVSMNLLISSRYHGIVFSSSEGVKSIAFYESDYYKQKMQGLLSLGVSNLLVIDAKKDLDKKEIVEFLNDRQKSFPLIALPNVKDILTSANDREKNVQ